jgi:protein farnesyltransferase subunit beta
MNRLGERRFPLCNADRLTLYVFGACMHENGGLKDKPEANRDFYHTCYSLSGCSVLNYAKANLKETDPVYNVTVDKMGFAKAFFAKLPSTHEELMVLDC